MPIVKEDCIYYEDGDCRKGLPGTPCDVVGCVAHVSTLNFPLIREMSEKLKEEVESWRDSPMSFDEMVEQYKRIHKI